MFSHLLLKRKRWNSQSDNISVRSPDTQNVTARCLQWYIIPPVINEPGEPRQYPPAQILHESRVDPPPLFEKDRFYSFRKSERGIMRSEIRRKSLMQGVQLFPQGFDAIQLVFGEGSDFHYERSSQRKIPAAQKRPPLRNGQSRCRFRE
jgi:hypothetical protein